MFGQTAAFIHSITICGKSVFFYIVLFINIMEGPAGCTFHVLMFLNLLLELTKSKRNENIVVIVVHTNPIFRKIFMQGYEFNNSSLHLWNAGLTTS